MLKNWINEHRTEIALFAAVLLFYSYGLGGVPLLDPDEPVYGQTGREMAKTGSWLTPRLNERLWFDKPPLYFWMVAVCHKVIGTGEFAARFPSAVMGAATAVTVYRFGAFAFGASAGLMGATILSTSIFFAFIARAAVTDMTLCFFMTLSFYMLYLGIRLPEERFRWFNWFYFISGFSVLTKGPVGIVLPLMVVIPFLAARRDLASLRALYSPAGFGLFAVSALPWYILMQLLHGSQFFNTFIGFHNLIRFLEPEHKSANRLWYHFPVLLVGIYPHIYALGGLIFDTLKKAFSDQFYQKYVLGASDGDDPRALPISFLFFVAAIIFAFFTASRTKLPTYILPIFPAVSILAGQYLDGLSRAGKRRNPAGILMTALIGGALGYAFLKVAPAKMPIANNDTYVALASICFVSAASAAVLGAMRRHAQALYASAALSVTLVLTLHCSLSPQIADKFTSRGICLAVGQMLKPGDRLAIFSKTPSALFYSDRGIEHAGDMRRVNKFLGKRPQGYLIMLESDYQSRSSEIRLTHRVCARSGKYLCLSN